MLPPLFLIASAISHSLTEPLGREAISKAAWLAEFREDLESYLTSDMVQAAIIQDRRQLPKLREADYFAFVDPSGGRSDSFTLGIAFKERDTNKIILSRLEEQAPPFNPKAVVEYFSEIVKSYGINEVCGDRYSGEWVVSAFEDCGIYYNSSELNKSQIYLEFEPLIAQGGVELLDLRRLVNQLRALERRTRSGGADLVDHPKGMHDDLANVAAGACVLASKDEVNRWDITVLN